MEVVGLKRTFHCLKRLHKLRYTFYTGDGNTKSFEDISKSRTITTAECTGHVQKHVGSCLCTIKGNYVRKKFSDGKGIGPGKEG